MSYPYAIPSLCSKHPALPNNLVCLALNIDIAQGDVVDPAHLTQANAVAASLDAILNSELAKSEAFSAVTAEIVRTAKARASTIQAAYASITFPKATLDTGFARLNEAVTRLIARLDPVIARLEAMEQRQNSMLAQMQNHRIICRNKESAVFKPVLKTVPGNGYALLAPLTPADVTLPVDFSPNEVFQLGAAPPFYHDNFWSYTHEYVLGLVYFYNEDFGIVGGDGLDERVRKVRRFFSRC